jgi:hypothetical protein
MTENLGEQMKYEAVADAIAMFQAALEKSYKLRGVQYINPITGIVQRFAENMMLANNMFPDMEK